MDRPIVSARKVVAQIFCLEYLQLEDLPWYLRMYLEPEITTQKIVALKHARQNAYLLWKVHEWNDCIIYDLAKETVRYRQTPIYFKILPMHQN